MFSPDGRWVAYQIGDNPERLEGTTYVQPFPPTGSDVSATDPRWAAAVVPRRQGAVLRAGAGTGSVVVTVRTEPSLHASRIRFAMPRGFGRGRLLTTPRTFDVMPDGRILGVGTKARARMRPGRRRFTSC